MKGHSARSPAAALLALALMVPLLLGQFGACTNDVPLLELVSISPSGRIEPGAIVQLSYIAEDRDNNAVITIFYDTDALVNTGDEILIATVNEDGAEHGAVYDWLTIGVPPLTYFVGMTIRDPLHSSQTKYYSETITIPGAAAAQFDLTQIGVAYDGSIWQGFNYNAQAGYAVSSCLDIGFRDPVFVVDTSPDGVDEFIIAARFGEPFARGNVGEAYLIFGLDGVRYIGTYELNGVAVNIPGALFVAPPLLGGITEGVVSVTSTPDHDGDGRAEIMFGLPYVQFLAEDSDYDPCDTNEGTPYLDPFLPNDCTNDPGQSPEDRDGLGLVSTGYMAIIPGSEIFREDGEGVCDLGWAGQLEDRLNEPNNTSHHVGARIKPLDPFDTGEGFSSSARYGQTVARMSSIVEGVYGQGDWLISAPNRDLGAGGVQVIGGGNLWDFTRPTTYTTLPDAPGLIGGIYTWPLWSCFAEDPSVRCIRGVTIPHYVQIEPESPGDQLGGAHTLGDFNADGPPDLTCGAPEASPEGLGEAGITYVVYGRLPFGDINVGDIDDPDPVTAVPGIELEGTNVGDGFGTWQDSAGDFNGDGIPDWIIGAPGRDGLGRFDNGMVAVIFGNPLLLGSYNADQLATPDLPAVVIYGAQDGDGFGSMVAPGGDINADGFDDILVSAPGTDPLARLNAGAVYVIFGSSALSGMIDVRVLGTDALPGRVYYGPRAGEAIGSAAAAGDVDNDGFGDILIGNPNADPDGRTNAGEAYLIYGFRR